MTGYLALVLHAHLPFVRHPEHPKFLEESWLYEAITEVYLPLIQVLEGWERDGLKPRLTLSLSPTLCAMLRDPLLQDRYSRRLTELIELSEKEVHRTHFDAGLRPLAEFYRRRLHSLREIYLRYGRDVTGAFARFEVLGFLELITCAATHPVLPLLGAHPPSVRAQLLAARDSHRRCFHRDPVGIWLPECAYAEGLEEALHAAGFRWFILDTHGLLQAQPQPVHGLAAPILTPHGVAVFGRDPDSARQVWSRHGGYPGDGRYRDFYRDIGFDLDYDYVKNYLPSTEHRGFTGIKYYRITDANRPHPKLAYDRALALEAVVEHAHHFLEARQEQLARWQTAPDHPPILVAPYDAELFGHWWYEGPEFLDQVVRGALTEPRPWQWMTPSDYLRRHTRHQVASPGASSWGEQGYWRVWLNETNEWILPHLHHAQQGMTALARQFTTSDGLTIRALNQAARELLLAQASDWPFLLRNGTCPDYARQRIHGHLRRFQVLRDQILNSSINEAELKSIEAKDNLFPHLDYRWFG
jgi:1,4-alpha-glucan branching enzyme